VADTATVPSSLPSAAAGPPPDVGRRLLGTGWLVLFAGVAALCLWRMEVLFRSRLGVDALGYALFYAAIPVVPFLGLFWWLQRRRPEPRWCFAVAFLWGAFVASYVALELNQFVARQVSRYTPTSWAAIFVAPWVEETAKAAIVFAIVLWRRHDFGGVIAGAVYAGCSAIGFAFAENTIYYANVYRAALADHGTSAEALDAVQYLFMFRGLKTPYIHPMFTIMTGIGVGVALRARHRAARVIAPAAGFCLAALLHMSYNSMATFASRAPAFNAMVYLILMPIAILVVVGLMAARRYEGRVLAARLSDYGVFGWLRNSTIPYIVEPRQRRAARRYARRIGKGERRRVVEYQRIGVDLAVLRDRMVRGVAGASELDRERVLIKELRERGRRIQLPAGAGALEPSGLAKSSW
jgi:RsiW-degrading membrane proteinase PrsW (M82 family)